MNYGSYTIVEELGRGGMGVVHKARHTVLGKPACVKLLLPEFTRHAEVVARFVNEAKAAASLDHPNIVDVLDCNQAPDGVWFIVLEYLEGLPLSKWLARHGGPVPPALVCRILVQAANALHTAHDHVSDTISGIVHRDVKPDNIFLVSRQVGKRSNDLHVVLLDFGIAKLLEPRAEELTRTGATIGTPAYMAPEQLANSKVVDRRADVYALGVVLYEMLTGGWRPWSDANNETPAPSEIYRRQTCEPPPDPRQRNPGVSAGMAYLVRRALACDPRERWSNAAEFAKALAEAVPADGVNPSGAEILRNYAEELWEPNDAMFGRRLAMPPVSAVDDVLWKPPVSAISIVTYGGGVATRAPDAGATLDIRPAQPPPGVPATTLGSSAAQSVPVAVGTRRSRKALLAVGAVVVAGGIAVAVVASSGGGSRTAGSAAGADSGPSVDATPVALTSVAVLTEPAGAAVFVDDELVGTSPARVQIPAGRKVMVRAELAGHGSTETPHVVGDRAETVRLAFTPIIDAATAADAGIDAAASVGEHGRPGGRRGGTGGRGNAGSGAASGTGSGSAPGGFDPENIAQ